MTTTAINLRGNPEYHAALDNLIAELRRYGHPVYDRNDLADFAIARVAAELGIELPERLERPKSHSIRGANFRKTRERIHGPPRRTG